MKKGGSVYIVTNKFNKVLYTGVTSNLRSRVNEHKNKTYTGFASKYNVDKLVYFENFQRIEEAITREKQIKAGSRQKKLNLINCMNPEWIDLHE